MKNKIDVAPFFEAIGKLNKVPVSKFDGIGWATVTSINPLTIKVANNVELGSPFIEKSPFCEFVINKTYNHLHKYDDYDKDECGGEGAIEHDRSRLNVDTSEVIFPVIVIRPLAVGEKVCVLRTNESQKYIILWRENAFVEERV